MPISRVSTIANSTAGAAYIREAIGVSDVEEFWTVALNPICRVIEGRMLFRGTVDSCFIHPRDIFRFGITNNATSLLVGHNHPSGSCLPSRADVDLTRRLKSAGLLLQIPIIDHIIVTNDKFYSFADSEWKKAFRGKIEM